MWRESATLLSIAVCFLWDLATNKQNRPPRARFFVMSGIQAGPTNSVLSLATGPVEATQIDLGASLFAPKGSNKCAPHVTQWVVLTPSANDLSATNPLTANTSKKTEFRLSPTATSYLKHIFLKITVASASDGSGNPVALDDYFGYDLFSTDYGFVITNGQDTVYHTNGEQQKIFYHDKRWLEERQVSEQERIGGPLSFVQRQLDATAGRTYTIPIHWPFDHTGRPMPMVQSNDLVFTINWQSADKLLQQVAGALNSPSVTISDVQLELECKIVPQMERAFCQKIASEAKFGHMTLYKQIHTLSSQITPVTGTNTVDIDIKSINKSTASIYFIIRPVASLATNDFHRWDLRGGPTDPGVILTHYGIVDTEGVVQAVVRVDTRKASEWMHGYRTPNNINIFTLDLQEYPLAEASFSGDLNLAQSNAAKLRLVFTASAAANGQAHQVDIFYEWINFIQQKQGQIRKVL